jgi:hypothetical protein
MKSAPPFLLSSNILLSIHFVTCWFFCGDESNPTRLGTTHFGYPLLFNQYIHSHHQYLEAFPPSSIWGRAMPWWHGSYLTLPTRQWLSSCILWSRSRSRFLALPCPLYICFTLRWYQSSRNAYGAYSSLKLSKLLRLTTKFYEVTILPLQS